MPEKVIHLFINKVEMFSLGLITIEKYKTNNCYLNVELVDRLPSECIYISQTHDST